MIDDVNSKNYDVNSKNYNFLINLLPVVLLGILTEPRESIYIFNFLNKVG